MKEGRNKRLELFAWITSLVIPIALTLIFIGCTTKKTVDETSIKKEAIENSTSSVP